VIYNPIKPITFKPEPRADRYARFLSVGRRQDPNKRFMLGASSLLMLGINYGQLGLVGSEYASYGEYMGVLKDDQLNRIYNSVDFVLSLGRIEGLNLTVLEGMAAGAIPVVCADMTTRKEILPPDLFPEYEDVHPTPTSVSRFIARYMQDNGAMEDMKKRLHKHYTDTWATRVSPFGVAEAILDVHAETIEYQ
jgi:glycosyltransferase involved in cell wall biosynthesis